MIAAIERLIKWRAESPDKRQWSIFQDSARRKLIVIEMKDEDWLIRKVVAPIELTAIIDVLDGRVEEMIAELDWRKTGRMAEE